MLGGGRGRTGAGVGERGGRGGSGGDAPAECYHAPMRVVSAVVRRVWAVSACNGCAVWQARDGESLCHQMTAQVVTPSKL